MIRPFALVVLMFASACNAISTIPEEGGTCWVHGNTFARGEDNGQNGWVLDPMLPKAYSQVAKNEFPFSSRFMDDSVYYYCTACDSAEAAYMRSDVPKDR